MTINNRPPTNAAPRLALNISTVWTEIPLLERFAAAANLGFVGVEMQFPYDVPAAALAAAAQAANVEVALINVAAGDLMNGGSGLAACPGREHAYAAALDECVTYVEALQPTCVNVLAGRRMAGAARSAWVDTFQANLARTRDRLAPLGVTTVFEAINTIDQPGFFIDSSAAQCAVMDEIGGADLKLQFDIYHMVMMNEDVSAFLREHCDRIGHIQFADVPGRGEPGSGRLDFAGIFAALEIAGYRGWLAAEYKPVAASTNSFGWLDKPPFAAFRTNT